MSVSVSRGWPSTGWMLSLGAGHARQAAAFFRQEAQDEFFGGDGEFVASASFQYQDALATAVAGGYRLHGTCTSASASPTPRTTWA